MYPTQARTHARTHARTLARTTLARRKGEARRSGMIEGLCVRGHASTRKETPWPNGCCVFMCCVFMKMFMRMFALGLCSAWLSGALWGRERPECWPWGGSGWLCFELCDVPNCLMYPTESRLQPDVKRSTPQVLASV